jgi:hypothetical protein
MLCYYAAVTTLSIFLALKHTHSQLSFLGKTFNKSAGNTSLATRMLRISFLVNSRTFPALLVKGT